ncbi:hypothetical protein [Campylobacter cuniculorum]|uniref:Uncharacterized protein n=2 Tax=Campylobacter cuniculorum TaxID=374106 RepID=A0A1W6BYG0_9BACT|nr:hypothetical protein [Campylobacter cuniculorum]ARJ57123.1 hypothetical protein CCUN_1540 [Campylobacter cuniculorum DSM 23162 = LMG 24588]QOR04567.1 hypothetical protein A0071_01040 [Campylobacter cuniculorum]
MTKEEFKHLRAEAGFKSDAELARALNISVLNINNWNMGYYPYPKYLRNILTLFKLKNHFDKEEYDNFLLNFIPKRRIKKHIKKEDRDFVKNAKIILKDKNLEELEKENQKLKQEIEVLENLLI